MFRILIYLFVFLASTLTIPGFAEPAKSIYICSANDGESSRKLVVGPFIEGQDCWNSGNLESWCVGTNCSYVSGFNWQRCEKSASRLLLKTACGNHGICNLLSLNKGTDGSWSGTFAARHIPVTCEEWFQ